MKAVVAITVIIKNIRPDFCFSETRKSNWESSRVALDMGWFEVNCLN